MLKKTIQILTLMLISTGLFAADANINTLRDFVKNFTTFSASFVQTQPDESTFSANESKGYMGIERPGKLYWVYQTPEPQEIVTDGVDLWIYESELDQATVRPLASVENDFPMRWLLYNEPVEKNFDVITGQEYGGISWFNLIPKDNTFFQSLEVAIKGNELVQIWMYQGQDNVTKVIFHNSQTDTDIADSKFNFVPKKGIDVIGTPLN